MWGVDYKYIIINNKGNKAFNYTIRGDIDYSSINKEQLCVHPKAKSVLAENFRFYTTEAAAVADANGTIGTSGTDYYIEGTTISGITGVTDNTFYVRYSLKDNAAIDINGEKLYKIQARNRARTLFYIAYQASDKSIRIKTTDGNNDSFLWKLESGDPYDMYIYNLQGTADHSNGVFTVRNVVNASGESALSSIYYDDEITSSYNQSVSPMNLQSFILTQGSNEGYQYNNNWINIWGSSYQIIGAYNAIENKPRDESPSNSNYRLPGNMPYYVCVNGSGDNAPGSDGDQLQFYRNWRVEDSSDKNTSQIKFIEVTQTYTFHIINNSGAEAISASTASALNAGATITESMIPDILKSPAANNYSFYPSAADAAAGTNALTRLPYPLHDVYVRYETNDVLDLSGEVKYNMAVGGTNYLWAANETTVSSATTNNSSNANYNWMLYGDDPYQVTIKNFANSKYITYNVSSGAVSLSDEGNTFFLHTGDDGKYELVATTSDDLSTFGYYSFGVVNNTPGLYPSSSYPTGNAAIQTVFEPSNVTQTYTFHIINNSGVEAISASTASALIVGTTITESMIPGIIKSPAASNYTFYPSAADASAGTNDITQLPYPSTDVYVRYDTNDIFNLSGELKYNVAVGGTNYLFASDATTVSFDDTSDNNEEANHKWTLNGDDAYQITLKNVDRNRYITYDVSEGEAAPTLSNSGKTFFLRTGSGNGNYELVATTSGDFTTSGYYSLGVANETLKLYASSSYPTGNSAIQTTFETTYASITTAPVAKTLTYNGASQALVTVGEAENGIMQYRLGDSGVFTPTVPRATNAGTYSVYYKVKGAEGFADLIVAEPIVVTISAKVVKDNPNTEAGESAVSIVFSGIPAGGYTYDGTAKTPGITVKDDNIVIDPSEYTVNISNNTSAGTATVTITDNADGNYIVSGAKTFTINKAPLTVTFNDKTITYGDDPEFVVAYSGFVNDETEGVLGGSLVVTGYARYGNVGTYTITPGGLTSDNYGITFVAGKLTVNPIEVGLEWGEATFTYNGSEQKPTATATGKVNNDEIGVTVTGGQINVGTGYTATASALTGEKAGNYKLPSANLTKEFSITKVSLTIKANDNTITYGDLPTHNGVTYDHFVGNDDESVLSSKVHYHFDYKQYDNVGNYVISLSDAAATNYDITLVSGTLTVVQKEVGLEWGEKTLPYTGSEQTPTLTLSGIVNNDDVGVTVSGGQTEVGNGYTATAALTGTKAGNYKLPAANTTTFSIGKAKLTVTANDHTITYGDEPANGGVTYSGFITGDDESQLTGTLEYDYDYTQFDDVEHYKLDEHSELYLVPYTITPKGLESTKYDITFEKGTLTVNPKEVTLTWDKSSFSCDGNAHAPRPTINTGDLVNGDNVTVTVTLSANTGSSLEDDGTAVKVGHYRAVATLKIGEEEAGNYKPVPAIQPFTIDSKIIGDGIEPATGITIVTTDGNNVTVTDGETQLVQDTHYTIETEIQGVDKYITVTGKGNYSGAARILFVTPAFYQPAGDTQYAAVYRATSDLAMPTGITPCIVKKVNPSAGILTTSPVEYIPEGVPVVLVANSNITGFQASAKPANVAAITAETEISNLLKVAPAEGVEVEAAQVYMFKEGEFVLTLSGTLPQGYFYLDNPNYHATGTGQGSNSRLRMVIDNSTGIDDGRGEMEEAGDEKWYTLDGRRLNGIPTQKGIYIVRSAEGRLQGKNGKKVIIR